jgi:hypothetical protein
MMGVGYYFTGSFSAGNYFGVNLYIASHILPNGQQDLVSVPSGISTSQGVKIYIGSMMENPLKFIYQRAQQLWLLWGFWANVNSHNFIMTVVFNALLGLRFPLLLFALYFFIISPKKNKGDLLFIIPIFVVTAFSTALHAEYRYTYPIEPLLIALFVSHFYFFLQKKQWLT